MMQWLWYVGLATSLAFLYKVAMFVKVNYLTGTIDLKRKYASAGSWAVVTGASEGIGNAMSHELARRGMNVVLIARSRDKLEELSSALIEKYKVQTKVISFDFATADPLKYKELFLQMDSVEVAVLVNNVGINYSYGNYYDEIDMEEDLRIVKVNCEAALYMTKYVIPRFKKNYNTNGKKRYGNGAIINLASVSAVTPTPMLSTYAATKAFMLSFSNGLHYELRPFGIDVLTVTPNLVVSKMTQGTASRKPRENFLMVNARPMASQTLNKLGVVVQTSGHANHAVIETVMTMLPTNLVGNKVLSMNQGVKRHVEKKRNAQEAK